jgi:hypothetical protein
VRESITSTRDGGMLAQCSPVKTITASRKKMMATMNAAQVAS